MWNPRLGTPQHGALERVSVLLHQTTPWLLASSNCHRIEPQHIELVDDRGEKDL